MARRTTSLWQGAGCQCRRRVLGLPRVVAAGDDVKGPGSSSGVAGDVVLLLGSSVVDKVLGVVQVVTLCLLLSQSHSGRLPISWLVFLLSTESFVEMMSLGFHSAAFLVPLSGFGVAIRRACRHFSFFCVSTQFVMLRVSICSSVLHFTCSIQSSRLSSWLAVLPSSSSTNEILLSWSNSSCVPSSS